MSPVYWIAPVGFDMILLLSLSDFQVKLICPLTFEYTQMISFTFIPILKYIIIFEFWNLKAWWEKLFCLSCKLIYRLLGILILYAIEITLAVTDHHRCLPATLMITVPFDVTYERSQPMKIF